MRIPGLWACSPEVVSGLWAGLEPCPFEALGRGVEFWELALGADVELAAKVGLDLVEQLGLGAHGPSALREGEGELFVERLPGSQRLTHAVRETEVMFRRVFQEVRREELEGGVTLWRGSAAQLQMFVQRQFRAVPAEQLLVLWRAMGLWLERPLIVWAWSAGIARRVWGPGAVRPGLLWPVMQMFLGEGGDAVVEALTVLRLMHGAPSVASHVMGRWLVPALWGPGGLSDAVPRLESPFWSVLPEAWGIEAQVREQRELVGRGQAEVEALDWPDVVAPSGVGIGAELALGRFARAVGVVRELPEALEETEGDEGQQLRVWAAALAATQARLDPLEDASGRLGFDPIRVFLAVVDQEVAVGAAAMVLKWRHYFFANTAMEEPKGFMTDVESFFAQTVARWDGSEVEWQRSSYGFDSGYWFGVGSGMAAVLPRDKRKDWRIEELLRPLVYAALSSMAAGLRVPHSERLYLHCPWVGEKLWRPTWAEVSVHRALAVLFELSPKGVEQEVGSAWAEALGVSVEVLGEWVSAQPFGRRELELLRQEVVAGEVLLDSLGGLFDAIYARPHFKPRWLSVPLGLIKEPREPQPDPLG